MDRILNKKKVSDYLESLADKHVDIASFVGTSEQELDDRINSNAGLPSPCLNFYGYDWKLSGNNQRTFNTRTISFAIIINGVKRDDYAGQDIAITQAETIGLEVLSRIYQDSMREDTGWLYDNVNKESIESQEIRIYKTTSLFGMEFHIDIRVPEPLVVDKSKWSDGNLFCE